MRLVFASNNAHKLEEVRKIMPAGVEVLSLSEIGFHHEIEETGETLEENSAIKARAVAAFISHQPSEVTATGLIDGVFADDTGLEIEALGGQPGVYTARWYRREISHQPSEVSHQMSEKEIFHANRAKAIRELEGKENRNARFRTVITLLKPSDVSRQPSAIRSQKSGVRSQLSVIQVEGEVRGWITKEEHGEGGFGYDPIFVPEGYDKTFGELPAEVKNEISHRARAMQELVKILHKEL